MLEKQMYVF